MSATPTPWGVDLNRFVRIIKPGKDGYDGRPYRVADAYESEQLANTPRHAEAISNAALIVTAVNAHETLVQAVKQAIQLASIARDWNFDEVEIDGEMVKMHDLKLRFETALAKATP